MTWRAEVLRLLPGLPNTFTTQQVYELVPALQAKYPQNRHPHEKLRQVLQELRDEKLIAFSSDGGQYTKLGTLKSTSNPWPFSPGQATSRQDLAKLFGQKGIDALRRGMFRPGKGHPWRQHMVLFHDENENPYRDQMEDGRIVYVGQGKKGDQKLQSYNRYLAEHLREGLHVHYFVQPKSKKGVIQYRGEVVLENMRYTRRPDELRSVYEFILVDKAGTNPIQELGQELVDMGEDARPPGYEERTVVFSRSRRVLRDPAFRSLVLAAYEEECAVCGRPLRKSPLVDLQAAHIVPVTERGRDVVNNGVSLCVRHHWAFDTGFFTLTDKHRIVWLGPEEDPHGEVITGEAIGLPVKSDDKPHPFYLDHHRRKWAST